MQDFDVECSLQGQSLVVPLNLLVREPIEIENNLIVFPDCTSILDFQLYTNFLESGYINIHNIKAVLRIALVADILSQERICKDLLSSIILPTLSLPSCLYVINYAQNLTDQFYSEINSAFVTLVTSSFNQFSQRLDCLPLNTLKSIFDKLYKVEDYREQLLEVIRQQRNCKDYLELLIDENARIENSKIFPEFEINWNICPNGFDETENFEFAQRKIKLLINSDTDLEVSLRSSAGRGLHGGLCRGLIVFQGTATQFLHLLGSDSQKIGETSQKTKNIDVSLLLAQEHLLYFILEKIGEDLRPDWQFDGVSKELFLLLIRYLKSIRLSQEDLMDLIAKWYECNPDEQSADVLNEYPWQELPMHSLISIAQKHPILKEISDLRNLLNEKIMNKGTRCDTSHNSITQEIFAKDEDNLCPPVSPSGKPFILDISDIILPTTEKKNYFEERPETPFLFTAKLNEEDCLSENETTCKFPRGYFMYSSPQKIIKSADRQSASEMLKQLKQKLINNKPHKRNKSLMYLMYPLFDAYKPVN